MFQENLIFYVPICEIIKTKVHCTCFTKKRTKEKHFWSTDMRTLNWTKKDSFEAGLLVICLDLSIFYLSNVLFPWTINLYKIKPLESNRIKKGLIKKVSGKEFWIKAWNFITLKWSLFRILCLQIEFLMDFL